MKTNDFVLHFFKMFFIYNDIVALFLKMDSSEISASTELELKSNMTLMSSKAGAGNVFVKAEIEKVRST